MLQLLEDVRLLACKPVHCPINSNLRLSIGVDPLLKDPTTYICLIGELLYSQYLDLTLFLLFTNLVCFSA